MQFVNSDIALEQDQAAVRGKAQLIGRYVLQDLVNTIGYLFSGFGDRAFYINHSRPELQVFGQGVLCKYTTKSTQVASSTASLKVQHVHLRLIGCWDDIGTIARSWSLTLCEVKNLACLRCLIRHVGRCATPVAPADMTDDLGVLDPLNSRIESFDSPILEEIGPGKLVELNEIDAEGIHFQDIFVDGFGNSHRPLVAGFVVEVVGCLGKHLDARILDLGRLVGGFLEGFGLLYHDSPMPPDLLGQRACMQTTIDRETQVATFEVVTQAPVVVIEGLVTVVIGMYPTVGNDV